MEFEDFENTEEVYDEEEDNVIGTDYDYAEIEVPRVEQPTTYISCVSDLLDFSPSENPPWRKRDFPSIKDAIKEICVLRNNASGSGADLQNIVGGSNLLMVEFIHHCLSEEDHGFKNLEKTKKFLSSDMRDVSSLEALETRNLFAAYQNLITMERGENYGMIEESMFRRTNELIRRGLEVNAGNTRPGVYSDRRRYTTFMGARHEYRMPEDMHIATNNILDRFNGLFRQSRVDLNEERGILNLFKASAYLTAELLELHPFSDGNGRTVRLLISYVLSSISPFPTPLFNIFSESSKNDFTRAMIQERSDYPTLLTTMMIECSLYSWRECKN